MCKSEIFAKILRIVSEETEISANDILSGSKDMDIVDARYLLVHLLYERGFYPSQIALHVCKTKRSINYILSSFSDRLRGGKILRIQYENIKKILGND
ncbi:hypothetical protein AAA214_23390 [Parabacteroides goldsteinii]|uniref:hypothetical protein n=1 Tax=Parabacteroides goldsteinii TaxID=328812 RepID=UPI0020601800|nr:MAG TPA: chromosomal replication initiator protein [Caudoviricetes sp.]